MNELISAQQFQFAGVNLAAHSLTTVTDLYAGPGQVELPALVSTTGIFWFQADGSLPSLTSVGGDFWLSTGAPSMIFPALTSIGGGMEIVAGQLVSFPVLTSLGVGASITMTGVFHAPAATTAENGLVIRQVSGLDLSALESVGPVGMAECTPSSAKLDLNHRA